MAENYNERDWEEETMECDATSERQMVDALSNVLYEYMGARDVNTFANQGLLTSDEGLVVRLSNGVEFQVTVVRSR